MIVTGQEIVLAVRFELPPNITAEKAVALLSQGGLNVPLGLVQFVRKIDVAVVNTGDSFTVTPPEEGVTLRMQ